jgi:hypothetical protein
MRENWSIPASAQHSGYSSVTDSGISGEGKNCHLFGVAVSHKEGHLIPPKRQSNLSADAEAREPGIGARYVPKTIVEIECAEVWRQISNYLDDDVDPQLRATMSSHFKDCAHCSAVLDGTRNVVKLVGDGRAFERPSGTTQRLYKKLNDHLGASERNRD